MKEGENTFMRITNNDIYDEIKVLSQHVQITNGKVKINAIMNRINLSLVLLIIGAVIGTNFF